METGSVNASRQIAAKALELELRYNQEPPPPQRPQQKTNGVAMPTDEDDQDGHFFYNHPERGAYFAA